MNKGIKEECEYKNNSNICVTCTLPNYQAAYNLVVNPQDMFEFEKKSLQRTYATESEGKGGLKPFQSSNHLQRCP